MGSKSIARQYSDPDSAIYHRLETTDPCFRQPSNKTKAPSFSHRSRKNLAFPLRLTIAYSLVQLYNLWFATLSLKLLFRESVTALNSKCVAKIRRLPPLS